MAPLTNEGENESYDDEVHHLGWTSFLLSELLYDILKTSEIIWQRLSYIRLLS